MYLSTLSENLKTSLRSKTTVFPVSDRTFSFGARSTPLNLASLEKRKKQRFNGFCHSPFFIVKGEIIMDLEKVRRAFKRNRFECSVFETAGEAAEYLDGKIDGETVGFGDSLTLQAMGMYEKLSRHNTVFDVHQINRERDGFEKSNEAFLDLARKAMVTDVFLTSVNGVSETGVMVNVDGTGNRVAGSLFGHKKVYFVLGVNKIMPTLEEAIYRARNVAAPKNVLRHGYKCGCSLQGGDRCYDCSAPDRICNVLAIYYKKMRNIEMEVILINEDLGY